MFLLDVLGETGIIGGRSFDDGTALGAQGGGIALPQFGQIGQALDVERAVLSAIDGDPRTGCEAEMLAKLSR